MELETQKSVELPEGKYLVADPCYIMEREHYCKMIDEPAVAPDIPSRSKQCGYVYEVDETPMVVSFDTYDGDGEYPGRDSTGKEYSFGVDSGMLAVVNEKVCGSWSGGMSSCAEIDGPLKVELDEFNGIHISQINGDIKLDIITVNPRDALEDKWTNTRTKWIIDHIDDGTFLNTYKEYIDYLLEGDEHNSFDEWLEEDGNGFNSEIYPCFQEALANGELTWEKPEGDGAIAALARQYGLWFFRELTNRAVINSYKAVESFCKNPALDNFLDSLPCDVDDKDFERILRVKCEAPAEIIEACKKYKCSDTPGEILESGIKAANWFIATRPAPEIFQEKAMQNCPIFEKFGDLVSRAYLTSAIYMTPGIKSSRGVEVWFGLGNDFIEKLREFGANDYIIQTCEEYNKPENMKSPKNLLHLECVEKTDGNITVALLMSVGTPGNYNNLTMGSVQCDKKDLMDNFGGVMEKLETNCFSEKSENELKM